MTLGLGGRRLIIDDQPPIRNPRRDNTTKDSALGSPDDMIQDSSSMLKHLLPRITKDKREKLFHYLSVLRTNSVLKRECYPSGYRCLRLVSIVLFISVPYCNPAEVSGGWTHFPTQVRHGGTSQKPIQITLFSN